MNKEILVDEDVITDECARNWKLESEWIGLQERKEKRIKTN